eukprot:gene12507-14779_t
MGDSVDVFNVGRFSLSEESRSKEKVTPVATEDKGKCQRREGNKPDDGYDEAKQFMESLALPDWVDWERVRRGQLFFLKHLVGASTCLLHISLIGGFGAPKINKKGGVGWNSVARVRLLHAAVRVRLKSQPKWDMHTWGLPINQEDLFVTTLAFSQVVLNGLERIGSTLTTSHEDMEDYLHLWRVIGHLMGVQPALLQRMESLWGAQAALESVVLHLVEPDASTRRLANHLIASMVGRLPTGRSEMEMAGLTRRLMGNHYADAMGIPVVNDPVLLSTIDKRLAGMRAIPQMMTIPFIGNALTIFTKWGLDKWIIL